MTATDRRRNMRAEPCRICGKDCSAGEGYLYRDTDSRTVRRLGRFGWFVKCAECHGAKETRGTRANKLHAAKCAAEPTVRPWSVSQVKGWTVERVCDKVVITAKDWCEQGTYRDRITRACVAKCEYHLTEFGLCDRPLSQAAAELIYSRIRPLAAAIVAEERAATTAIIDALANAGATITRSQYYPHSSAEGTGVNGDRIWVNNGNLFVNFHLVDVGEYIDSLFRG